LESQKIDFLDLQERDKAIATIPNSRSTNDPMSLESLAQAWLKQLESNPESLLIPAQHHSHTPEISQEWLTRVKQLLNQIDLSRLITKLLERSQELPQEIANDLRELQTKLIAFQKQLMQKDSVQLIYENSANSTTRPAFNLNTAKVIAILSLTLLVANLAAPDAVFAKGSTSFGGTGDSDGIGLGFIGLMMTMGGVYWLIHLANTEKRK
jgi:spermidine synthase